jgi:predicted RNA methylase
LKCENLHAWSRIAVELVNDDALEINLSSADGIEVLESKIVDNTKRR